MDVCSHYIIRVAINIRGKRVFLNTCNLVFLNKELHGLCSFQWCDWNYTLRHYGGEQLHVSPNPPPGLGRN